MIDKPELEYTTKHGYEVTLSDPKQLVIVQGYSCINGGKVRHNGKMVKLMVRYDDKPDLANKVAAWQEAWEKYEAAKAAEFAANVPGLDELRAAQEAAYNEQARHDAEMEHMFATGDSILPKPINESLHEHAQQLAGQYPRAAMYLRAEDYTFASNFRKAGAGEDAMTLIARGGSIEDAEKILKNWVPENAMWD